MERPAGRTDFYSHAPRGARPIVDFVTPKITTFLLTRPSRGATIAKVRMQKKGEDFYSHAPRGARLQFLYHLLRSTHFYSHAPRGARRLFVYAFIASLKFLLTRPSRGATVLKREPFISVSISTHTPLAGRDLCGHVYRSRSPISISTHTPLAGRDLCGHVYRSRSPISTHTPLAGRDASRGRTAIDYLVFLLTRPSRGATTCKIVSDRTCVYFYSHAPRGARLFLT